VIVSGWFLRPVEKNLSDADWTMLVSGFGGLVTVGLLVTSLLQERFVRVTMLWAGLGVLELVWLVGFVWWQAPAAFEEGVEAGAVLVGCCCSRCCCGSVWRVQSCRSWFRL
ncbi:MAG: hypothetical protein ACKPJJ_35235, partial [Planctomycetaceae bacterium]